jgi:hypothetical protein
MQGSSSVVRFGAVDAEGDWHAAIVRASASAANATFIGRPLSENGEDIVNLLRMISRTVIGSSPVAGGTLRMLPCFEVVETALSLWLLHLQPFDAGEKCPEVGGPFEGLSRPRQKSLRASDQPPVYPQ